MELHNIIPIAGFTYLAYDNVNPAMVNSMMLRSSMLAFEKVYSPKSSLLLNGMTLDRLSKNWEEEEEEENEQH